MAKGDNKSTSASNKTATTSNTKNNSSVKTTSNESKTESKTESKSGTKNRQDELKTESKSGTKNQQQESQVESQVEATGATEAPEKKLGRFAGVVKPEGCPNVQTAFAKLTFDVMKVRKWMQKHYSKKVFDKKPKASVAPEVLEAKKGKTDTESATNTGKSKEQKDPTAKISDSHFVLTACEQTLFVLLINLGNSNTKKKAAGLYDLSEEELRLNILANENFSWSFGRLVARYDSDTDYIGMLDYKKEFLQTFAEKYCFNGGNSGVNISGALNLVCYLLQQNRIMMADHAFHMANFRFASSITSRAMLMAINTNYKGQLQKELYRRGESMIQTLLSLSPDRGDKTDSKKDSKKGSKQSKEASKDSDNEVTVDDEEDDEDEEGEEEDDDEEDGEEEEEEEPVPPPKRNTKKSSGR